MRIVLSLVLACIAFSVHSQQRPLFQTTKVEGTENVYVFRYGGHQSMFVVTSDKKVGARGQVLGAGREGSEARQI